MPNPTKPVTIIAFLAELIEENQNREYGRGYPQIKSDTHGSGADIREIRTDNVGLRLILDDGTAFDITVVQI